MNADVGGIYLAGRSARFGSAELNKNRTNGFRTKCQNNFIFR